MKHILPLLILSSSTLFAQQPAVPGSWTIIGDVEGYPVKETCTFTQEKEKVTGSCIVTGVKTYDTTVTVTDQKVVFVHASEYEGQPLTITYTGTSTTKAISAARSASFPAATVEHLRRKKRRRLKRSKSANVRPVSLRSINSQIVDSVSYHRSIAVS